MGVSFQDWLSLIIIELNRLFPRKGLLIESPSTCYVKGVLLKLNQLRAVLPDAFSGTA